MKNQKATVNSFEKFTQHIVDLNTPKSTAGHTPGPWTTDLVHKSDKFTPTHIDIMAGVKLIALADYGTGETGPDREANARLISAAPDLLAACQQFLRYASSGKHPAWGKYFGTQAGTRMVEAIVKAEGK